MKTVRLGRTNITVNKNGFGALPIQRLNKSEAKEMLQSAYKNGIDFYDTARWYTDSEEKIGNSLGEVREKIILATKTGSNSPKDFWIDLEKSLSLLKTNYIDIYQFHNPAFCPKIGDGTGMYEAMLEAKQQGKIRFIGITNHRLNVMIEAVNSDLYDTIQYPFSYLAEERDIELVRLCQEKDVGFIAMKALSGGLITNSKAAYAFLSEYKNVLPIWGIQKNHELDEFISYISNPPKLTPELAKIIENDRNELIGEFCRGCGYCLPCPKDIRIDTCARMSLLIRRSPSHLQLTENAQNMMNKISECTNCGNCIEKCPYKLNTPKLLKKNYNDYLEIVKGNRLPM